MRKYNSLRKLHNYSGDTSPLISMRRISEKMRLSPPISMQHLFEKGWPPKVQSLNAEPKSPQEIGTKITWTAHAKDPEKNHLEFQFKLDGPHSTSSFPIVRGLSVDNKWVWDTEGFPPGLYQVEVEVVDNSGNESSKVSDYNLKPKPEPTLEVKDVWLKGQPMSVPALRPYVSDPIAPFGNIKIYSIGFPIYITPIVAIKLPKLYKSTNDCNDSSAIVVLLPGQKTTPSQMREIFGSETPIFSPASRIIACVSSQNPASQYSNSVRVIVEWMKL